MQGPNGSNSSALSGSHPSGGRGRGEKAACFSGRWHYVTLAGAACDAPEIEYLKGFFAGATSYPDRQCNIKFPLWIESYRDPQMVDMLYVSFQCSEPEAEDLCQRIDRDVDVLITGRLTVTGSGRAMILATAVQVQPQW